MRKNPMYKTLPALPQRIHGRKEEMKIYTLIKIRYLIYSQRRKMRNIHEM